MCNPTWINILGSSELTVDVTVDGGATVTGSVATTDASGTTRRTFNIDDFPLSILIESGVAYRVSVYAASGGHSGTVTVVAQVTGDSRDPDTCILEVDENHLAALTVVTAIGG